MSATLPGRALVAVLVLATLFAGGSVTACGDGRKVQTIELVVPAGTSQRLVEGQVVTVMPARLELRVGDTLLIRNEDSSDQSVGPYFVKAGGEIRLTYGKAGQFEGYCPLTEGKRYAIVVTA